MLGDTAQNNPCFRLSAVCMGGLHLKERCLGPLGLGDWDSHLTFGRSILLFCYSSEQDGDSFWSPGAYILVR